MAFLHKILAYVRGELCVGSKELDSNTPQNGVANVPVLRVAIAKEINKRSLPLEF
jgi:hypothetical protein